QAAGRREPAAASPAATADAARPAKRKRVFPYRKVPDIEADIAVTEAKVGVLEAAMQSPDVYRDAPKLRQTMVDLEAAKNALAKLYQHWEEAVELNG
ncbi:MAG TPA: ABC transporter C-terminal domain-containing protein, partial [Urbifossiella sp.]|nr:ABC transporter C-terminal domain-containing protein [Urbifossiella sp.]